MASILIIDDDRAICQMLSTMVERLDHDVTTAFSLKEGMKRAQAEAVDVVFLDLGLPDGNGLDLLPKLRNAPSTPEVIIITGHGGQEGAELSVKYGAWDYIEKPVTPEQVSLPLARALQYREAKSTEAHAKALRLEGIVGQSPPMQACFDALAQAAFGDANVLITGETGTGKELFARAVHGNGTRATGPFVPVDCAALPETLVESMLFGHEKGAFTGADSPKTGLIRQAEGGTLFLDEVGELAMSVQSSFLRVLQERRFRPVGGHQEIGSDFRLIAATNRELNHLADQGQFRRDLLFRLHTISIELPRLRERVDDIKPLVFHHAAAICERYGVATKGFAPEFLMALEHHTWPGNVRELVNTLEKAIAAARNEPTLFPKHLPTYLQIQQRQASAKNGDTRGPAPQPTSSPAKALSKLKDHLDAVVGEAEKKYLEDLLTVSEGNIKEACRISGLSRSRLYVRLKKHGISRGA